MTVLQVSSARSAVLGACNSALRLAYSAFPWLPGGALEAETDDMARPPRQARLGDQTHHPIQIEVTR